MPAQAWQAREAEPICVGGEVEQSPAGTMVWRREWKLGQDLAGSWGPLRLCIHAWSIRFEDSRRGHISYVRDLLGRGVLGDFYERTTALSPEWSVGAVFFSRFDLTSSREVSESDGPACVADRTGPSGQVPALVALCGGAPGSRITHKPGRWLHSTRGAPGRHVGGRRP